VSYDPTQKEEFIEDKPHDFVHFPQHSDWGGFLFCSPRRDAWEKDENHRRRDGEGEEAG
jgi:hypothetical protein